jgi:hypothetical protein
MEIKKKPIDIWQEHKDRQTYNQNMGFYETIEENNEFFIGNQWGDVESGDLDLPVFNIIKNGINMFIALIKSNDISFLLSNGAKGSKEDYTQLFKSTEFEVNSIIEDQKIKPSFDECLKQAAIEGDMAIYTTQTPRKMMETETRALLKLM